MDIADIRRQAQAGLQFNVTVGTMQFTLRLPTQHQVDIAVARNRLHEGADDPALLVRVRRALVEGAVVAWTGVTAGDLAAGLGAEPVDLSAEAVGLLMDAREDVADALNAEFLRQRAARIEKQGAAEKN